MGAPDPAPRFAAVVLPCGDLDVMVAFMTAELGFRLESIFPADDPAVAEVTSGGVRVRLERGGDGPQAVLRIEDGDLPPGTSRWRTAPNGTRVELVAPAGLRVPEAPEPAAPAQVTRRDEGGGFVVGRAGMGYRDLIPDRLGGRFIASHIRIDAGGPVPDYVHFHRVRLQFIYCHRGWVQVVYEDQGEPFVLREGDAVLQPPEIRHRVLGCSPGLEVVEISCPAQHETRVDPDLELPNAEIRPQRSFGGQAFVRHLAADAGEIEGPAGVSYRDLGVAAATEGLAGTRVYRLRAGERLPLLGAAEFHLLFLVEGGGDLHLTRSEEVFASALAVDDCCVVASGSEGELVAASAGCRVLEVVLPAAV